jgi:heat shock protein HspQ
MRAMAAKRSGRQARFNIGDVVRHRVFPFRGIIFDIDPVFNNTEEWWLSIPEEVRPRKDQPFYHLLAENEETEYVAYVSEQNLLPDDSRKPLRHPQIQGMFKLRKDGSYQAVFVEKH